MKKNNQKNGFISLLRESLLLLCIIGCIGINEPSPRSELNPAIFFITSISEKAVQIGLHWDNKNIWGDGTVIIIERAIGDQSFHEIATVSCSTSSIIDSSLDIRKNYSYRAFAKFTGGDSSSYSSTVTITYSDSCTLLRTIQPANDITLSVLSYDGKFFITYYQYDTFIRVWNTADWTSTKIEVGDRMGYNVIRITRKSDLIVLGGTSSINIFRRSDGSLIRAISVDSVYITDLILTSAGDKLASADLRGNLRIWDVNSGALLRLLDNSSGQQSQSSSFAINPSDNSLVVCSGDPHYSLNIWNLVQYTVIKYLGDGFSYPVFNSDGSILSVDRPYTYTKTNYSTKTWSPLYSYTSLEAYHAYGVTAFSPDDSLQLLADNYLIRVARVSTGEMLTSISSQEYYRVLYVAFFPDGMKIIANTYSKIFIWSTPFKSQWVVVNP